MNVLFWELVYTLATTGSTGKRCSRWRTSRLRCEVDHKAARGGVQEIEGRELQKADGDIASLSKFTLI